MSKKYIKMNKEKFEKKLYRKFGFIYRKHSLPMSQTCMCWGIATGNGWYQLIWDLSADITKALKKGYKRCYNIYRNTTTDRFSDTVLFKTRFLWLANLFTRTFKSLEMYDDGFSVEQVKEKFGTLRFYTRNSTKEIDKLIDKAEVRSEMTCEVCGMFTRESNLKGENWVYNMCDTCWAKSDKSKRPKDLT